jgi:hypothetical protein
MTSAPADPDLPCYHPEFDAFVNVGRIGEGDDENPAPGMPKHFVAEITIKCGACGEPFRFLGVPGGLSLSYAVPSTSLDSTELRAPIRPEQAPPAFPRRGDVTGVEIRLRRHGDRP